MSQSLKFSVITVCLNSSKTILRNILSVNNQKYKNIEHIFIDGLSSDGTIDIIKKESKIKNLIISEIDDGLYHAMNKGIDQSKGDIIIFLNSDDFFFDDNVIYKVASYFNDGVEIVYGSIQYYNIKKKKISWRKFFPGKYYAKAYLSGWHPPHPAFFIKKNSIKKKFDEKLKISADFDFMFFHQEILCLKSRYFPFVVTTMSTHGTSTSFKNILIGNRNVILSLKSRYANFSTFIYIIKRFLFKIFALK